ncbi:MAG: sensor histidine kinase [Planctomycetota bacterium]|jgi:signal transduction histidine kinase
MDDQKADRTMDDAPFPEMDAPSLRKFLDFFHEGVLLADSENRIVYVNRAAQAVLQRPGEEMLENLPGDAMGCLHSEDNGCGQSTWCPCGLSDGINEILAGGEPVMKETLSFPLRRGDTVEVRNFTANIFALPGHEGEEGRVCILLHDVTHWMRTSDELRLAQDMVEKRASQCESMTETIIQDIRSPLTHRLDAVRQVGNTDASANLLNDLEYLALNVENLLLVSQLDSLGLPMTKVVLDPVEILSGLVEKLRSGLPEGAVGLEFTDPGEEIQTVAADRKLLTMTLENLLRNALSQSPEGKSVAVQIRNRDREAVVVSVRREGKAFPEEHLSSVFDADFHLERPGGQGRRNRGLPFCSLAVEAQGGEILAENPEGGGVAFHLTLAVRRRTAAEPKKGGEAPPPSRAGEHL